jgi:hypothetical protein
MMMMMKQRRSERQKERKWREEGDLSMNTSRTHAYAGALQWTPISDPTRRDKHAQTCSGRYAILILDIKDGILPFGAHLLCVTSAKLKPITRPSAHHQYKIHID